MFSFHIRFHIKYIIYAIYFYKLSTHNCIEHCLAIASVLKIINTCLCSLLIAKLLNIIFADQNTFCLVVGHFLGSSDFIPNLLPILYFIDIWFPFYLVFCGSLSYFRFTILHLYHCRKYYIYCYNKAAVTIIIVKIFHIYFDVVLLFFSCFYLFFVFFFYILIFILRSLCCSAVCFANKVFIIIIII